MLGGLDDYLLPSEGDHIQRAVHEATGHQLGGVLREHCVTHAMVGRDILNGQQTQPSLVIASLTVSHVWEKAALGSKPLTLTC